MAAVRFASAWAACFATSGETSFGGLALMDSGIRSTATRSTDVETERRGVCLRPMRAVMPSGSMKVTAAQLGRLSFSLSRLIVTFSSKDRISTWLETRALTRGATSSPSAHFAVMRA